MFANCDTHTTLSVVVTQYDPIYTVTPTVTDNSGLVASLTSDTADLLSPIAGNLIIVWTASDSSGNTATCVMNVTVRGKVYFTFCCYKFVVLFKNIFTENQTVCLIFYWLVVEQVPPTFTCPSSGYVYLSRDLTTQLSINASQATPSGIAVVTSNVVSPLQIVVNVSQLWRMQQFSQVAYDNFGNSARCSFQLVVARTYRVICVRPTLIG